MMLYHHPILSIRDLEYSDRLRHLKLPTLAYRRHRADMIQTYRLFHGIDRSDPNQFFLRPLNDRTRGHSFKLSKVRAFTSIRMGSFSQRVVNLWNALPAYVIDSPSVNSFKSNLEKAWRAKYDMYNPKEMFPCYCIVRSSESPVHTDINPAAEGHISNYT